MRPELKTIEFIEKYLLNTLDDSEKQLFEERMATDPDFKNEVALQEQLTHSLERISLQETIQSAQKTYTFWKFFKLIGVILIPIVLVFTTWYFINLENKTTTETEIIPTKVEQEVYKDTKQKIAPKDNEVAIIPDTVPKQKAVKVTKMKTAIYAENTVVDPLKTIATQLFTIATKKDTIIETQNGIVFLIPKNTFVDSTQNVVNGNIQVEIKEAVDSHTIMTSGLSTLFDDKPLETGGMFFIEAKKDGEKLQIHPDKEVTADIPTQDYKEGMQLFDGEKAEDGTINWTNPKSLDNKKFTDSLYYSFSTMNTAKTEQFSDKIISLNYALDIEIVRDTIVTDAIIVPMDSVKTDRIDTSAKKPILGLDPLKVKAIWNERYQNTFIATKAFEERLQVIHQNCADANSIFDVYVKNLDRNLYEVDKMVVTTLKNTSLRTEFETFQKQRLTNVPNKNTDVSKLNNYYIQQQKVYRLALVETQRKMDSLMSVDEKYKAFSKQQLQQYYLNELAITTEKVAQDIDVKLPRIFNRTQRSTSSATQSNTVSLVHIIKKERRKRRYRAPIRRTGWKNIDRIINEDVVSSVKSRTTTTVKTREKSVTISYSEYEVSIENTERFDKLFVYLVPTKFNSFVKLTAKNNRFAYKLNDLLSYRVYGIGYVDEVPYYFEKTIRNTSDKIQLAEITEIILKEKLANITTKNSSLETEILYQTTKKANEKILKKYREIVKLKKEIENVVFPCIQYKTLKSFVNDVFEDQAIPFGAVEESPLFPNYNQNTTEAEKKTDFGNAVKDFIRENFNMNIIDASKYPENEFRISFSMRIDTSGIMNLTFSSKNDAIRRELNRIADLFPKVTPGKQNGIPVDVTYAFSIVFTL